MAEKAGSLLYRWKESNEVSTTLSIRIPDHLILSPYYNPMDYNVYVGKCYMWDAVVKDTSRSACNTKTELVIKINEVFESRSRNKVRNSCTKFRSHLEAVLETKVGYLEKTVISQFFFIVFLILKNTFT